MKRNLLFLMSALSIFAMPAFAHAEEMYCFFNSDSDYEMNLTVENGTLTHVTFVNADWSQTGPTLAVARLDADSARGMDRYQVSGSNEIIELQPQILKHQEGRAYTPVDDRDYHCN